MKFEPAHRFYYLLQAEESGDYVSVEDGVGCALQRPKRAAAACCSLTCLWRQVLAAGARRRVLGAVRRWAGRDVRRRHSDPAAEGRAARCGACGRAGAALHRG